jgi:hypothetical protein
VDDGPLWWGGVKSSLAEVFRSYETHLQRLPASVLRDRLASVAKHAKRLVEDLRDRDVNAALGVVLRKIDLAEALDAVCDEAERQAKKAAARSSRRRMPDKSKHELVFFLDRVFDCFCPLAKNSRRRAALRRDFISRVLELSRVKMPKDLDRWIECPAPVWFEGFCQKETPDKT